MAAQNNSSTSSLSTSTTSTIYSVPVNEIQVRSNSVRRKKSCSYCYICPRILARSKESLKEYRKQLKHDHFLLIGAKRTENFYRWIYKCICRRLLADDFLTSLVASVALFAIGIKVTKEMFAWKLPPIC